MKWKQNVEEENKRNKEGEKREQPYVTKAEN